MVECDGVMVECGGGMVECDLPVGEYDEVLLIVVQQTDDCVPHHVNPYTQTCGKWVIISDEPTIANYKK